MHAGLLTSTTPDPRNGSTGTLRGQAQTNTVSHRLGYRLRRRFTETSAKLAATPLKPHTDDCAVFVRAGIQVSRASVRRILGEERPPRPKPRSLTASVHRTAPDQFFKPTRPNRVWHMDMTVFRVLWMRFEAAAIIDGFSRKIMAVRVSPGSPTTARLIGLIDEATQQATASEYIVADRGGQFQGAFRQALRQRGIQHARGRSRTWRFNAEVERLFGSLKRWWRFSLVVPYTAATQKRLGGYTAWHNLHRPHEALDKLTPNEAAQGVKAPEPVRYTERRGDLEPTVWVRRQHVGDDPRLLYLMITARSKHRSAA